LPPGAASTVSATKARAIQEEIRVNFITRMNVLEKERKCFLMREKKEAWNECSYLYRREVKSFKHY
jgi:hypothetical protein